MNAIPCAPPNKAFTLVLSYYSADDTAISMPLACLSAYIKKYLDDVDVHFIPIQTYLDAEHSSPEQFAERALGLKPDLLAFSAMSPHWAPLSPYLAEIKSRQPDLPVLVGGYQAILSPEETMAHRDVDFICVGDGERPLADLIRYLRGEIAAPVAGMWGKLSDDQRFRTDPVLTEDLSGMPFPDYSLFEQDGSLDNVNKSVYGRQNKFILPVMTGRGCPYRCTYCSNTPLLLHWKGKKKYLRKYEPAALIDELCRLRDRYGVECFEFWDELFMSDMKFLWDFLERYRREIGLPFSINSRVENMDERFCATVAEAGCHSIWFGLESGSESYRINRLGRKMSNRQILSASRNAQKFGIQRLSFNIIGMPFEAKQNMLETLALNMEISPDIFFFFIYIPLKGTPLYDLAARSDLLIPETAQIYNPWVLNGEFRLNIKEHPGGATNEDLNEVCQQMLEFQKENNRFSL